VLLRPQEFKVPDRPELYAVVRGSIVLVTARLLNIPPGVLVEHDRLVKMQQEKEVGPLPSRTVTCWRRGDPSTYLLW
jgi:hypothetical protein